MPIIVNLSILWISYKGETNAKMGFYVIITLIYLIFTIPIILLFLFLLSKAIFFITLVISFLLFNLSIYILNFISKSKKYLILPT